MTRLNVNIDHVATIRQARRTFEPGIAAAAVLADLAGADGITVHLRGDRRHIQDDDVRVLRSVVKTHLNLEMASTPEMVEMACEVKPDVVTLVPERPEELTTEGGLNVESQEAEIRQIVEQLTQAGILVSIFVDPSASQIAASHRVGARQVEICTARYAEITDPTRKEGAEPLKQELGRIAEAAWVGGEMGLQIAAGHGLTYRNVRAIAQIHPIEELNIGHNIVARAVLVGLERAVREMVSAMNGKSDRLEAG